MTDTVTFRPITDADQPFLLRLYASTRADELAQVPWSAEERAAFLEFQFRAQHQYYQEQYPGARFDVIERAGEQIGRLYLDVRDDEHRLIDIALLPEQRGSGLGTRLMHDILAAARADGGKLVRIHVEQNNPAMHLYLRLGFEKIEERGIYHLMEWHPDRAAAATARPANEKEG